MTDVAGTLACFLLLLAGTCALAPGLLLRMLLMGYPGDDPRRKELWAEFHAIKRLDQPFFVMELVEPVLLEGVTARQVALKRAWRARGVRRSMARGQTEMKEALRRLERSSEALRTSVRLADEGVHDTIPSPVYRVEAQSRKARVGGQNLRANTERYYL